MSSSPGGRLWNGDEDVATPFLTGAVSGGTGLAPGAHLLSTGCPHLL